MDSVLLQLCPGGRRDIGGEEHGGRLEGDGWQGGEKGGVRRMRLGCCNAIWWRTGRGEAGGEVEEGAGEPSYYSDVCWSSVDGREGGAMSSIHVRHGLLPLAGLWRKLMF